MQAISVTVGPLATASANNIAVSQTTSGAANLTLNGSLVSGGVATLDVPRRVVITNVGNDTGITFTITGTTFNGAVVSQTLTGTSGSTVETTIDFATVTQISTSGSTSVSGVTVGTTAGGSTAGNAIAAGSRWVRLDDFAPALITVQVVVSGTVNYTIQETLDDPNDPISPVAIGSVTWFSSADTNVVGKTGSVLSYFNYAPKYARILLNSSSGTGSVTATFLQSSNGPI